MLLWLSANGSTIVITLILIVLVFLAGRKITKRKGSCGCGHCCGCCDYCCFKSSEDQAEKNEQQ
jgi:hypothetical protein